MLRTDSISIPITERRHVALIDIQQLKEDELHRAAIGLSGVVDEREGLVANYPSVVKNYGSYEKALNRLQQVQKINDQGFFARLIVVTTYGNITETLGMATVMTAKPGMENYEKKRKTKANEARLQSIYARLSTNITFWCGDAVMCANVVSDVFETLPLDPIAGGLVDAWGRKIEKIRYGGVYTLLPEVRELDGPVDPTESLRTKGWVGTGICGESKLAGVDTVMEVVVPS